MEYFFLYRRLDAPDVTGSSLTLGAAGSRRTVYLIDENSKLPDTSTQSNDSDLLVTNNRSGAATSNNNNDNGNNNNNHADQVPNTFLMYNRISNVIGDTTVIGNGSSSQHSPKHTLDNGNASKDKRTQDDEKAVWYEYGCV